MVKARFGDVVEAPDGHVGLVVGCLDGAAEILVVEFIVTHPNGEILGHVEQLHRAAELEILRRAFA